MGPVDVSQPIDLRTWPRREHFAFYRNRVPCAYGSSTTTAPARSTTSCSRGCNCFETGD
ncbi:MAG: CatA-like O-acetyltransferase [Homoserinimonas sp.]